MTNLNNDKYFNRDDVNPIINKYDKAFLLMSLQRMADNSKKNIDEYYELIKIDKEVENKFITSLTISYSEFFRNNLTFSILEHLLIPKIISNKKNSQSKEIRIWSAACSEGQEPYSIAMIMEELKSNVYFSIDYRIFATDISEKYLENVIKGEYLEKSLENISIKRVQKWFLKQSNFFYVKPELKRNIDFSCFDLLDKKYSSPPASIFGNFDIVFCSNILFYYENDVREEILDKISNSLTSGGYLITGEVEREILFKLNYKEVYPQSAIFEITNRQNKEL